MFLEKAITLDPNNADYFVELGFQKYGQMKFKDAARCYNSAIKINKENIQALIGKLRCQITDGSVEEAAQELELLSTVQQNINTNAVIFLQKI